MLFRSSAVLLGPLIWRVPINEIDFTARLSPPSWQHPFGTDDLGQDLLARMLYGGRISLAVGFAAMVVAIIVGILIGAISGISRGSVDAVLMWITDLFLALPQLPRLCPLRKSTMMRVSHKPRCRMRPCTQRMKRLIGRHCANSF